MGLYIKGTEQHLEKLESIIAMSCNNLLKQSKENETDVRVILAALDVMKGLHPGEYDEHTIVK